MGTYLFIFESIGTQELLLIGIIALVFLGPRKMPEIARKLGKIMNEFRNTTNEFKATWEREVNFEQEAEALRSGELPDPPSPVARENSILQPAVNDNFAPPEIKEVDPSVFENATQPDPDNDPQMAAAEPVDDEAAAAAKENWL
jgi:Tat protein translocase TatB subunit